MKSYGIIMAMLIFAAVAISGCLSGEEKPAAELLEPRENSDAGVQVTVIYLPEIEDATAFDIEVTAHSDYNDDFNKNSYLRDANGKIYQPLSYEGSGGHHAKGILKFPKSKSRGFELVIKDIAGVEERVFKW